MADSKPQTGSSWWQTLPGILTGLAAIITAATGLIVAFNHTSNRSEPAPATTTSPSSSSSLSPARPTSSSGAAPAAAAASQSSGAVALPEIHQVKLAGGDAIVTILAADVEPIDADRRSLKFRIRHMNAGRFAANFWGNSYRLLVDDVPRAPTNSLNEVVERDSAKEGDVVFEVPLSVKNVVLQISAGEEKSRLPLRLP